ncbi:MAG: hypothetical protein QNJ40_20565 [Xanthomonadales bacterium]|nr:hypothetical protein [Xanthomonadales bacterium]
MPKSLFGKNSASPFAWYWQSQLVLLLAAAGLVLLAVLDRQLFTLSMQEDGWAEWATFYCFLIGGLLFAAAAFDQHGWLPRLTALGLAAFCVVVAAEEISWGQRLVSFQPPEVFLAKNFQQELNVHNFLKDREILGIEIETKYLVIVIALAYGVVAPIMLDLLARVPMAQQVRTLFPPLSFLPWFLLVAYAEYDYPVSFTGEAAELYLGLIFLLCSVRCVPRLSRARTAALPGVAAIVLGVITPGLLDRIFALGSSEKEQQAKAELAAIVDRFEMESGSQRKLMSRRRVHKRLYTSVMQEYLKDPAAVTSEPDEKNSEALRQVYYLDPWNNPYWLFYERNGMGILYSFGANRRRDSKMRGDIELAGDDVVVTWQEAP